MLYHGCTNALGPVAHALRYTVADVGRSGCAAGGTEVTATTGVVHHAAADPGRGWRWCWCDCRIPRNAINGWNVNDDNMIVMIFIGSDSSGCCCGAQTRSMFIRCCCVVRSEEGRGFRDRMERRRHDACYVAAAAVPDAVVY